MRKYLSIFAGVLVCIVIAVVAITYRVEVATAIGSILRSGKDVPAGSLKMRTSDATTTPEFIVAGISSSTPLTFASENFSSAAIELQVFGSSTATQSKVQIERFASDDNINFYPYQVASTTNFLIIPYTAGATTTAYIDLGLLPARYTRIIGGVSTTTSGAAAGKDRMNIWMNIVGEIK